jgi:hypothetical protein
LRSTDPNAAGKEGVPVTAKYVFDPQVTEEEWLALGGGSPWPAWCSMPVPEEGPDRKKLLLVAHLVRQVADQMTDPRFVEVIEVAERYADGLASQQEKSDAHRRAYEVWDTAPQPHEAAADAANVARRFLYDQGETAEMMVGAAGSRAARLAGVSGKKAEAARREAERAMESRIRRLINEVHGNPFRPVTLDPAWRSPAVAALARAAYEERLMPAGELDPSRLRVLSDAVAEAGCADPEILGHLRGPGPHIRGCWAVDLLLGKG